MKTNRMKKMVSLVTALMFSIALITGCAETSAYVAEAEGGVLLLKVNPEIAIAYDKDGKVTKVDAKNDDASKLLANYASYEGKEARAVVTELVTLIGNAGYFVEEVEGEGRQITLEIEKGSQLPSNAFLEEMVADIKDYVNVNALKVPINLVGESDYGMEYNDTDYGTGNDGVTDYDTNDDNNDSNDSDDNDTDYGPNNDGVTDYNDDKNDDKNNDTDYGPNNDGVTDYNDDKNDDKNNDTDYGPNNDGVTDYSSNSSDDSGNSNYGSDNDED